MTRGTPCICLFFPIRPITRLRHRPRRAPHPGARIATGFFAALAFLAAIAVPLTLAIATGHRSPRDPSAGYAQAFDAKP